MNIVELNKIKGLKGEITPPPDKSVSHRAVMFASIAEGHSRVRNSLRAEDPVSTMNAMRTLGVEITEEESGDLVVEGKGLHGLTEPLDVINCGNSGTTVRLISGMLAGNPFFSVLTGDDSLRQRPMARVISPLREMGAVISGRKEDKYLPLSIRGGRLKAMNYTMPTASAQVKSCLVLAGLYADGTTVITEPFKSRDHTERMLGAMGADLKVDGLSVKVGCGGGLHAIDMTVPSDFSSAAFFMAAALIVPNSDIVIRNVGINPTRTGFLDVIRKMGAVVEMDNVREVSGEPVADFCLRTAPALRSVKIGRETVSSMIDEFPVLCVLASQAEGVTEIRGAEELRVKESDRIRAMAVELRKIGVEAEEYPDGIAVKGKALLKGCEVESYGDHRIAMSLSIAALVADGKTIINNASCVDISFPGFYDRLREIAI